MPIEVVLYTQPDCASCRTEKQLLSDHGIPYVEKNVQEDAGALQELRQLGAQATPVTVVNGKILVGYKPNRLKELLRNEGFEI